MVVGAKWRGEKGGEGRGGDQEDQEEDTPF
jgi:hypothetical protein